MPSLFISIENAATPSSSVIPIYWGYLLGIGSLLMQAAFEIAQQNQCTAVVLDVANTNPDARRLYERLGFTLMRTIEFRYLPKWISSGANIMRKELISS